MTDTSASLNAANDSAIALAAKCFWASQEPPAASTPSFRLLFDAAARKLTTQPAASPWRWRAVAVASVAVAAIAALLATSFRSPTLQDDLALARTVSFESVWHSPSDRLLAHAPSVVMHDMPEMPQPGVPNLAEEYL
jgi:hypothetical protein